MTIPPPPGPPHAPGPAQQPPDPYPPSPYQPGQHAPPGQYPPGQHPPGPPRRKLPTGVVILLAVGIPLVILALIVAGSIAAVNAFRGTTISESADADAGSLVRVDMPNAAIDVTVGADDEVSVTLRGTYSGTRPNLDVSTTGEETEISGGCPGGWFLVNNCRVRVEVSVPADVDVTVSGRNGAITTEGLSGDLDLSTTNGAIEVDESRGILELRTTNGRIELDDSRSAEVQARTTNGAVDLAFSDAPDDVSASSTNGQIRIEVPDDGTEYAIDADTTNGKVDTADVPSDGRADRVITANTTNGAVTIETSR